MEGMNMKTKHMNMKDMKAAWLSLVGGAILFAPCAGGAQIGVNLLTNPGAETGDMSGWTIDEGNNGGNGWSAKLNSDIDHIDPHSGNYYFATSYEWDIRYQIVDLINDAGFTPEELDAAPPIRFSEWAATRDDTGDYTGGKYYMRFALLGEQPDPANPLAEYLIGSKDSPIELDRATAWFENTHTFTNYGSGVRYLYFEDGGRDKNSWAGHYGTHFDDASVMVVPEPSSIGMVGGLALLACTLGFRSRERGNRLMAPAR